MKIKSQARLARDARKAEALFKHKYSKPVDRVEKALSMAEFQLRDSVEPVAATKSERELPAYIINKNEISRMGWYRKSVFA